MSSTAQEWTRLTASGACQVSLQNIDVGRMSRNTGKVKSGCKVLPECMVFFINISKGGKQIHLQNEPLTFNLAGCTSYLDCMVHLAHLGPQWDLCDACEVLTAMLGKEEKWLTSAAPASSQSTFFRPGTHSLFMSTSKSLRPHYSPCMQSSK